VDVPQRMGAVLLEAAGRPPTFGTLPVPEPGPGQVLVRIAAAPINPSDLGFLAGSYGFARPFPLVPGFEGSGTVVATGPGIFPRLLLGRRVACASSGGGGGTWAEYMVASAASCIPLSTRLSFEHGASAFVNPMTALAFMDIAREGRHRALVSSAAAGALGRMILRLCSARGIPAVHIVRRSEQVETLRASAARHVLVSTDPDFTDALASLARRLRATLFLDPVGGTATRTLLEAAPPGSTLLSYGSLSGEPTTMDVRALMRAGKSVTGFFLPDWLERRPRRWKLTAALKVARLLDRELTTTVQARFPLSSIVEAIDTYRQAMSAGKVLLLGDADRGRVTTDEPPS